MIQFSGKVVVITGAASGMGRSMALRLAREGAALALADVDEAGLKETAAMLPHTVGKVSTHTVDVSSRERVERFAQEVDGVHGRVDVLINNAGVALGYTTIERMKIEDFEWLMRINFWGTVYCTKAFLPILKRNERANIANMSSAFGMAAMGLNAAYTASKFAVRGFTEALRQEEGINGVRVTVILPGNIRTNIAKNARPVVWDDLEPEKADPEEYVRQFERFARTSADEAARQIIEAIRRDKRRVLIGADARLFDHISRWHPSKYGRFMVKYVIQRLLMEPSQRQEAKLQAERQAGEEGAKGAKGQRA